MAELISRERARHEFALFFQDSKSLVDDCDSLLCMLPTIDAVPKGDMEIILHEVVKRSKPKWIPVTQKLPNYWQEVLLWDAIDKEVFMGALDDEANWFIRGFESEDFNITHWMPLPEPPKDGDG